MSYSFKLLPGSDIEQCKQLLYVFGNAFEDKATYHDHVPHDEYLQKLLSKETSIVLVALENNNVIGGLIAYELEKFEQDRREIYIYDLAVDIAHRRKGVATGLIQELKEIAKKRDAYVIFVQADHGDGPAIALYESLGIKEDVHHFDIEI